MREGGRQSRRRRRRKREEEEEGREGDNVDTVYVNTR